MRTRPGARRALVTQVIHRLFGVDRTRATRSAGVEREMLGDPGAGTELGVARHELRDVMAGFGAVAEARQCDMRAELAALDVDPAMARDGRDLVLQPLE